MNYPVSGMSRNPLVPVRAQDMQRILPGGRLREHEPATGAFMCRLNGQWILREEWDRPVMFGDVIEWYDVPQGKDNLRTLLQIVVTIVGTVIGGPAGAAFAAFGNLAIGFAMAPDLPQAVENASVSPTYTTGLAGNKARPFEAIPKICGRHVSFPPFAAQPYYRYDAYRTDSEGKEVGGDQYYYAIFAVGVGHHRIERSQFDDTSITHYSDVILANYLPPMARPSMVIPEMVTASEVVGQEMLPSVAIGGFVVTSPHNTAKRIEYDVMCPQGLGRVLDNGAMEYHSVRWRIDVREVDEFGVAITNWVTRDTQTLTAGTREARRLTFEIELPEAIRPEVRMLRLDVKEDNDRYLNTVVWAGLRARVEEVVPLNPDVAHYELVLRASQQLSQVTQNRFNLVAWGMIQCVDTYDDEGNVTWTEEQETRSAADWMVELARSETWGLGLPLSRIDIPSFMELRDISAARQDHFDYVFDTSVDAWTALQLIARSARARVFRRAGVLTVARDQWDDMPVTAFTHGNAFEMSIEEQLPQRTTPDGIIVEYFDYRSWTWLTVDCPAPGVTTMSNPTRERLLGVVGPTHAKREGLYEAAQRMLRTRVASCRTEMEGILPSYLSVVRWLPDIPGYGQTGDIVDWNSVTRVMRLAEPVNWVAGQETVISVRRPDGTWTEPSPITPGETGLDVVLSDDLDFDLVGLNSGTSERPTFIAGAVDRMDLLVKITGIADGGEVEEGTRLFAITALVDDIRVHEADNEYLPSPGEIQDPINPGDESTGGGGGGEVVTIPRLDGEPLLAWTPTNNNIGSGAHRAWLQLDPNGRMYFKVLGWDGSAGQIVLANRWVLSPPIEPTEAERFEVMFTYSAAEFYDSGLGSPFVGGDPSGVWLPLTTSRSFIAENPNFGNPADYPNLTMGAVWWFNLQIREIASGDVLASGSFNITNLYTVFGS